MKIEKRTKIEYLGESKKKIKKVYDEMIEAEYIGYDGDMCCRSKTELGALRKFKRRMRDDVGEIEAGELSKGDIGVCWLHLVDESDPEHADMLDEDCDWFVSYVEKSDYPLFSYRT